MSLRILITGVNGFIGRNLVKKLSGNIRAVSLKPVSFEKNVEVLNGDLTNENFVKKIVKDVEVIIHLAAIINPNDRNIYNVNVNATRLLVNEAKKNRVKKFIYISTENVLSKKLDNYSDSKLKAEQIVKNFENHIIFRPTVIYGKGDKNYVGKIVNLIKKFPIIPFFGKGEFQPIYVNDFVDCIKDSILNPKIKGMYLIPGPTKISFKEFIKKIQKILNKKRIIIYIPTFLIKPIIFIYQKLSKKPFITISQLDNMNKKRIYDIPVLFKIKTTIDEGLKKTITS